MITSYGDSSMTRKSRGTVRWLMLTGTSVNAPRHGSESPLATLIRRLVGTILMLSLLTMPFDMIFGIAVESNRASIDS